MNIHDAIEQAYKNGYEAGKKDAVKWTNVKDRLPEPYVSVLVYIPYIPEELPLPTVHEGYYSGENWYAALIGLNPANVTHWQPLPEPPKED